MPLGDKAEAALPLRAATLKQKAMITRQSGERQASLKPALLDSQCHECKNRWLQVSDNLSRWELSCVLLGLLDITMYLRNSAIQSEEIMAMFVIVPTERNKTQGSYQ